MFRLLQFVLIHLFNYTLVYIDTFVYHLGGEERTLENRVKFDVKPKLVSTWKSNIKMAILESAYTR